MNITFVNEGSGDISLDLGIIRNYLIEKKENCNFRYAACGFGKNEQDWIQRHGIGELEKTLMRDGGCLISSYGLSAIRELRKISSLTSILSFSHYSHVFGSELALERFQPTNIRTFYDGFTYVIPGSPFGEKLLKKTGCLAHATVLKETCSPLAWYWSRPRFVKELRSLLEEQMPQARGKKILAVIRNGSSSEETKKKYDRFPLRELLEMMGEDWFICTNIPEIVAGGIGMKGPECRRFAYISSLLPSAALAGMSDMLVTNEALLATAYAGTRKPLYVLRYSNTAFEKYCVKHYPELVIRNGKDLIEKIGRSGELRAEQDVMENAFSYSAAHNPCAALSVLCKEK